MDIPKLISEVKQGYLGAQKCLYDVYLDRLYLVCKSYVKNDQDAEECCSDGFCKIFKGINSLEYNGEAAFYMWMKRTMINQCLMYMRSKNSFNLVAEVEADELPFPEDALNKLAANEIYGMIGYLPTGCRSVFNLYVLEGMSHIEIAGLLGIAEATSRVHLANARKLLQKMITENEKYYKNEQSN